MLKVIRINYLDLNYEISYFKHSSKYKKYGETMT